MSSQNRLLKASTLDVPNILKDARNELQAPARRLFGKRILSLGGLAMLSGCNISDDKSVNTVLRTMSRFNDEVQWALFDSKKLAPTYPESMITRPFPFNAFYDIDDVPIVDEATYKLPVGGLAKNGKSVWTLAELRALPQESQVTRHICIEGWSAIGKWGGVRFADFLKRSGADTSAKSCSR